MNAQKSQTVSTEQDMLKALADIASHPQDFMRVDYEIGNESFTSYVCREPLKASRKLSYRGGDYVRDNGDILGLNLPQQVYLNKLISKRFGIPIRHGSLNEQVAAFYSEDASYKNNVQIPHWTYTGEVIRKFDDGYDISKMIDAEFVRAQSADLPLERNGQTLPTEGSSEKLILKGVLGPVLQTEVPTRDGYFSTIRGIIPTDSELGPKNKKSKGRFGGIYLDEQDLAAVRSVWDSVGGVLDADAGRPLSRGGYGALGVWTDENPKK